MSMTNATTRRRDGRIERLCKHGVGHPTHESAEVIAERHGHDVSTWLIHGCDGCCENEPGVGFPYPDKEV